MKSFYIKTENKINKTFYEMRILKRNQPAVYCSNKETNNTLLH